MRMDVLNSNCHLVLITILFCLTVCSDQPGTEKNAPNSQGAILPDESNFNPQRLADAFPPIIEPQSVAVETADEQLSLGELVLGIEINGESRAYPINMLASPPREVINDRLGGQAIAATW